MEGETVIINSQSYLSMIWEAIASVGWYIVGVVVLSIWMYPYLEEKYKSWKQKKDDEEYSAKYHKNPDVFEERMRAVEAARLRLQQKYLEEAERAKEQEEERKKLKQEQLKKLLNGTEGGNKLGTGESSNSSYLRDEYNPLMGESSQGYRAPKRSCCGKKCG
ncbi:GSCOCG00002226001-RA-CDS [Cotesia congregata]|uniref:Similar to SELENOS: Selenoprotein S (Homo sapiens) n=1 Tax=Cotesia congregata TaxID=51543 RepID=A0A8J2HMK9_COTCN|nr:GSCOCG00002226001-RA-CDS [Cotesia congregata]CAG5103903.1 Similar to SELENOS: Selenoprotein S (Homo sapiens) [Cotesia congregata]